MLIARDGTGRIIFSAEMPEDTRDKIEMFAKHRDGSVESVPYHEGMKLVLEQEATDTEAEAEADEKPTSKNRVRR